MIFQQVIFILIFKIFNVEAMIEMKQKAVISPRTLVKTPRSMVEVKCQLLTTQYSVFDLQLVKLKGKETTVLNTTVVDNTTSRAWFGPVDMTDNRSYIYCITNTATLARRRLLVGVAPTAPTKMDCISYHLISMECRFTPYLLGNLITNWVIQYTNSGFGGIYTTCQSARDAECILGSNSDNLANPFYPMLNHTFRVNVTNYLGSSISLFEVDPWKVVKPDAVSDLRAEIMNSTCIKVTWSYSSFPPLPFPLQYQITVNSSIMGTRKVMTYQEQELVCDLSPNTEVKVTVYCETTLGGFPSDFRSVTAQMPEDKPHHPMVPTGAFSVRQISNYTREITLYWQEIPSGFHHGTITQYKLSVFNDSSALPIFTQAIAPTSLTAVISPELKNDANYRILIQAKTSKGYSDSVESAMVCVSDENRAMNRVAWVDSEFAGQGVYTVYWSAGTDHPSVTRVYWCYGQSKRDGQVICYTSIKMEPSSANSTEHTLQVDEASIKERCDTCQWNVGVSMETNGSFSGIVWNGCRFRRQREPRLDEVVLRNVTELSVTVTWQHVCWLVTQFGRPEYYELGVVDKNTGDPKECHDIKVTKVPDNHGEMVKTMETGPETSLCIRAIGRDKPGAWLIRPIVLPVVDHGLSTEVVAGMSASLVLFGIILLLLIVRLCVRKKWFDKIYIEDPQPTKFYLPVKVDIKPPIFPNMKDNPIYGTNHLKLSGSSATKETIVSDSTPSPRIIQKEKDHFLTKSVESKKLLSAGNGGSTQKPPPDKGFKDFATGLQCSTISTEAAIEYPLLTGRRNLEEADEFTHKSDDCHEYSSISGSGSTDNSQKHNTDDSMAAFSGSFDEDGLETEGSLSYVQAGCDIDTLQERELLLQEGQGWSMGDNSHHTKSEANIKSSKSSEPSIDGSNYLRLNHTTNPNTGCNYYHHGNANIYSGESEVEISNNDNVRGREGQSRCSNPRKSKHKYPKFVNGKLYCANYPYAKVACDDDMVNGNIGSYT